MIDSEKMIWAAAFALRMRDEKRLWERGGREFDEEAAAVGAAEIANAHVLWARGAVDGVVGGFGEDDDVTEMLREMVGR